MVRVRPGRVVGKSVDFVNVRRRMDERRDRRRTRRLRVFSVVLLLLVGGIGIVMFTASAPTINIGKTSVKSISLTGTTLEVQTSITNHNYFSMRVDKLVFNIKVNNLYIGQAEKSGFEIPAHSTVNFTTTLNIKTDLWNSIMDTIQPGALQGFSGKIVLTLNGMVDATVLYVIPKEMDFSISKTFAPSEVLKR